VPAFSSYGATKQEQNSKRSPCVDPRLATKIVALSTYSISIRLSGFPFKKKINKKKSEHQVYPVPKEFNYRDFQQLQRELD